MVHKNTVKLATCSIFTCIELCCTDIEANIKVSGFGMIGILSDLCPIDPWLPLICGHSRVPLEIDYKVVRSKYRDINLSFYYLVILMYFFRLNVVNSKLSGKKIGKSVYDAKKIKFQTVFPTQRVLFLYENIRIALESSFGLQIFNIEKSVTTL